MKANRSRAQLQGPVRHTHISEPSNLPVSAYKLLWNLMLLDSNLVVIFADKQV